MFYFTVDFLTLVKCIIDSVAFSRFLHSFLCNRCMTACCHVPSLSVVLTAGSGEIRRPTVTPPSLLTLSLLQVGYGSKITALEIRHVTGLMWDRATGVAGAYFVCKRTN